MAKTREALHADARKSKVDIKLSIIDTIWRKHVALLLPGSRKIRDAHADMLLYKQVDPYTRRKN